MNKSIIIILTFLASSVIHSINCSQAGPLRNGYYEIRAMHSHKCLDVPKSSNRDEVEVIQYSCHNTKNQRWKLIENPSNSGYYEITAMHSGKCLDVPQSSTADGVKIIQYRCFNTTNQRWMLTEGPRGYYTVNARHSRKCLDVPRSSAADSVEIIQYRCAGTTNQRWEFIYKDPVRSPQRLDMVVVSIGGSTSTNIHPVVGQRARELGYTLVEGDNWFQDTGDIVAGNSDAERIKNTINRLASRNGGEKSSLSLLVVGKSAGGVLAWNTFKRHHSDINDFQRVTLVTVDPHGSVWDDGQSGPYTDHQDLWWPAGWSSDTDVFRVYNIYQYRDWPYGANFPDRRVYRNIQITGNGITHGSIPNHERTGTSIREAIDFALNGRR